jgi:hypothetical protein
VHRRAGPSGVYAAFSGVPSQVQRQGLAFGQDCFGLDQSQVRLYAAIARHTVLVMATLAGPRPASSAGVAGTGNPGRYAR